MADAPPPTAVRLVWTGDLAFTAIDSGGRELPLDTDSARGTRPVEALLVALGGCMAIDVVSILRKMRCPPRRFEAELRGEQMPSPPRYFRRMTLALRLAGEGIDDAKVARAVGLSRETYCSVLLTLRPDLELDVTWEIEPGGDVPA